MTPKLQPTPVVDDSDNRRTPKAVVMDFLHTGKIIGVDLVSDLLDPFQQLGGPDVAVAKRLV